MEDILTNIIQEADFELEGLPWLTEYHILKNKRYVVTNNVEGTAQLWAIDQGKLIKTYHSQSFSQVKAIMDLHYDVKPIEPLKSWF